MNLSQPIRDASRNECQTFFCIGLHFAFFGDRFFVSDCTSFLEVQHDTGVLYRIALRAQLNTHTFVSQASTGKPQPQHGLGMSSWAHQSSNNDGQMST